MNRVTLLPSPKADDPVYTEPCTISVAGLSQTGSKKPTSGTLPKNVKPSSQAQIDAVVKAVLEQVRAYESSLYTSPADQD